MKTILNKTILGLLIILTIALVPRTSVSKSTGPETIVLSEKNLLVLNSVVDGQSAGAIIRKAKELDAALGTGFGSKTPLYVYLNTPGGSVLSGQEIIEAMRGLGRPVHTITAFAASMGFQIAENLDERYILESGVLMSHRAAGQFEGSFGGTNPSQLDQRVHLWVQITKELDEQTVKRTKGKQTTESYQKAYANELWMTGAESVAEGYADSIIRVKCDKSLSGTTKHQVEYMGMPITYELDNCPINTSPLNVQIGGALGVTNEYLANVKTQFLAGYEMKMKSAMPMSF